MKLFSHFNPYFHSCFLKYLVLKKHLEKFTLRDYFSFSPYKYTVIDFLIVLGFVMIKCWKLTPRNWRRKCQPTSVFLLGKSHGQRSLEGHSPWGHKERTRQKRLSKTVKKVIFHCLIVPLLNKNYSVYQI